MAAAPTFALSHVSSTTQMASLAVTGTATLEGTVHRSWYHTAKNPQRSRTRRTVAPWTMAVQPRRILMDAPRWKTRLKSHLRPQTGGQECTTMATGSTGKRTASQNPLRMDIVDTIKWTDMLLLTRWFTVLFLTRLFPIFLSYLIIRFAFPSRLPSAAMAIQPLQPPLLLMDYRKTKYKPGETTALVHWC